jgi:hypothetical protein
MVVYYDIPPGTSYQNPLPLHSLQIPLLGHFVAVEFVTVIAIEATAIAIIAIAML